MLSHFQVSEAGKETPAAASDDKDAKKKKSVHKTTNLTVTTTRTRQIPQKQVDEYTEAEVRVFIDFN